MGWVRGQTGEQKRKEKQRPPRGWGLAGWGQGRPRLGCWAGCPQESFIHDGRGARSMGDRRRPTGDFPGGPRVGAAQNLLTPGKGEEGREGTGGAGVL